jgi:predicted  nucleic acid-binding Zn-ribbon protein
MSICNTRRNNEESASTDYPVLLKAKELELTKLEKKYKDIKGEKLGLEKKKKALKETIKTWQGKCKTLGSEKKALKDEIQQQWVEMVAYSIIRGYPCSKVVGIQRVKKKARNIGKHKT